MTLTANPSEADLCRVYQGKAPWSLTLAEFTGWGPAFPREVLNGQKYERRHYYGNLSREAALAIQHHEAELAAYYAMQETARAIYAAEVLRRSLEQARVVRWYPPTTLDRTAHRAVLCFAARAGIIYADHPVLREYPDLAKRLEKHGPKGFDRLTPWPGSEERVELEQWIRAYDARMGSLPPEIAAAEARLAKVKPEGEAGRRYAYHLKTLRDELRGWEKTLPNVRALLDRCAAEDAAEAVL